MIQRSLQSLSAHADRRLLITVAQSHHFSTTPLCTSSTSSNRTPTTTTTPIATTPSSHLTSTESSHKKTELSSTKPPSYLTKALGVQERPRTDELSREEWRRNLLDKQKRVEERKHLVKQVSKGYFNDYNELRHKGGKAWIAPNTLIRDDLSLYFPDIKGKSLGDSNVYHTTDLWKDKVSLVAIGSFKSSEEHVNSFVRPTLSDMKNEKDRFQYVYINIQENPLKSFLVSMFLSSLRKQIPVEHQKTYLISNQSMEYIRESIGMNNQHVGYVYLVDQIGKIRWAGCDWATVKEEESLRKCTHVLLNRMKEGSRSSE